MKDPNRLLEDLLAHDAWIRSLASRLVRDEHAAQDVVQDAWMEALEKPPRKPGPLRSWMRRVVRSFALMRHRTDAHRRQREERAARGESLPSVAEMLDREETRIRVARAVASLEEPCRSTVLYRYFEGLPPREIAARLDVSVSAVHERLRRGLQKLRARLDRDFGDRKSWCAALVPLIGKVSMGAAAGGASTSILTGALIMSTKVKIGIAALLVVGTATTFMFWPREEEPRLPAVPGTEEHRPTAAPVKKTTEAAAPATNGRDDTEVPARKTAAPGKKPAAVLVPKRGSIVGTVTDLEGTPLPGATVAAFRYVLGIVEMKIMTSARTNEHGEYELKPIHGRCLLGASDAGHYTERRFASPFTRQDFRLGKPGTLRGKIVFATTREPCADVTVAVYRSDPMDAMTRLSWYTHNRPPVISVRSIPDGTYRIEGLRPGAYRVRILSCEAPQTHSMSEAVSVEAGRESVKDFVVGRGFVFTGRVTDKDTGEPVAGARVTLVANERKLGITDDEGRYTVQGLEWDLVVGAFGEVKAQGYRNGSFVFHNNNFNSPFTKDFTLRRAAEVNGRVLDPAGEKVAGARVGFFGSVILERNRWNRSLSSSQHVTTGADGSFSLSTPASTRGFQLSAAKEGFAWGTSERIVLKRGEKKEGVVIRLGKGGRIRGRVQDETGAPVASARVNVRTDRDKIFKSIDTRADGCYELEAVHDGVHGMDVYPPGLAHGGCSAYMTAKRSGVAVSEGQVTEINWVLRPGSMIAGRVVDENGHPVAGAAVRALRPEMRGRVFPDRPVRTAISGAEGRFRIEGFEEIATKYLLEARKIGYEPAYGKAAETGQTDLLLTVKALKKLEGRVVDAATGQPVPEFRIHGSYEYKPGKQGSLYPRRHGSAMSFADFEGRFSMHLPPGKYEIEAHTPDGMRSDSLAFEIFPVGQPKSVVLGVWRAGSLSGKVLDPEGKPIPYASVGLWDLRTDPVKNLRWLRTDTSGRFEVRSLPAGSFVLEGFARGTMRKVRVLQSFRKISISTGENREISLPVAPGAEVEVVVTSSGDRPVPGAKVTVQRADGIPNALKMSRSVRSDRAMSESFRKGKLMSQEAMRALYKSVSRRLTVTDPDGRLATLFLPPGRYTIHTAAEGFKPVRKTVVVTAGRKNEVAIEVRR